MGKIAKRRHPAKSPFTDKWRRATFEALVASPYGLAAVERNADVQLMHLMHYHRDGTFVWEPSRWYNELVIIFHEVAEARARARGRE